MIVKSIKFSGFKNAKERIFSSFQFGQLTKIIGDNYVGKTTIGEAITWGLYGCNLTGNDKADSILINKKSKRMHVTLDFVDDSGQEHTLIREKKGSKTSLALNDGPTKQSELLKILPDKNIFLAVFNLEYFNSLGSTKARELLMNILPSIGKDKVLSKLSSEEQEILKDMGLSDTNFILSNLRKDIVDTEKDIEYFTGQKELLEEQTEELESPGELKEFDSTELDELTEQYEAKLKQQPELLPLPQFNAPNPQTVDELSQEILILAKKRECILEEKNNIQREVDKLKDQYRSTNSKQKKVSYQVGDICNTCGQSISEDHIEKCKSEADKHNKLITEELRKIAEQGTKKAQERDELQKKYDLIIDEIDLLSAEKQKIENANNNLLNNYQKEYEESCNAIKIKNQKIIEDFNENGKEETVELKERINQLKEYQQNILAHNNRVSDQLQRIEKLNNDYEVAVGKVKDQNQRLMNLEIKKSAVTQYALAKSEMQLEPIKKHLDKVEIQLEKVVKSTGEIKPTFDVFYDGREFNILSYSERLRVGLEIANLINQIAGLKIPIFLDNAESITHYKQPDTQIIESHVVKGKELTVEVA